MRFRAVCIPCIFSVRSKEILESDLTEEEKKKALRQLMKLLYELFDPNQSTTYIACEAFRYVKQVTHNDDPYRRYKEETNRLAKKLLPRVLEEMKKYEGKDLFKKLVAVSVNANILDPGVPSLKFKLTDLEKLLLRDDFAVDHRDKIYDLLLESKKVIFLLDNAGEAVFDKLIVDFLATEMGLKVWVVAKDRPYQNDVTVREALKLGLGENAQVLGTGSDYSGLLPGTYSKEVKELLKSCDLVIAKGMAHYETFLYAPPERTVAHLFKAKCQPVAETLGVAPGSNIALLKPPVDQNPRNFG